MSRIPAALAFLLVGPSCASYPGGSHTARDGETENATAATVVVVPPLTVAPPTPPPAPADTAEVAGIVPAANPACVLTAHDIELASVIPLHLDESAPFFHVDEAEGLEARLASPRSTVRASQSNLEIIGHVKLSELPVRPKSGALVDGYIRVNHASLRDGDPAHLELSIETPWFLKPVKAPTLRASCDELALADVAVRVDTPLRGKAVELRSGAPIAVRARPGGPVVATMAVPKARPGEAEVLIRIYELERRGEQVRVRVEWDEVDVEGWVARRDVSPQSPVSMLGMLGALPGGGSVVALTGEAPLLVHAGDRVVRVGTARPGTFGCVTRASAGAREIELDFHAPFGGFDFGGLGAGPQPTPATLFVAPTRGEACVKATGTKR